MASSSERLAWVYIPRCADHSLYVGHTTIEPAERAKLHNERRDGRYTALRWPVTLVYSEPQSSGEVADDRERQLKRWTRAKRK
jgi:putative endonuclease